MCLQTPSKVYVEELTSGFQLNVNGQPFYAQGAGLGDVDNIPALAKAGATCFRTWSTFNAQQELDLAHKHGLMVALGFDLQKELYGFDYNDDAAVANQFERFKKEVEKFKNHPSLLCWVIANEPNLLFDQQGHSAPVNTKVYDALNDMICYLHKYDPNHPVTYAFAGVDKDQVSIALAKTPTVDIVSLQVYGELEQLADLVAEAQINKPIMVTEYGPLGHWQTRKTAWGREIEEASEIKAQGLKSRIIQCRKNDKQGMLVGDFVFYWGQKQERTPTWYGMFDKNGLTDARVDVMTEVWSSVLPNHLAPQVNGITLNKLSAEKSVITTFNTCNEAVVDITPQGQEKLEFDWYLLKEVEVKSDGGAFEKEPDMVNLVRTNETHISNTARLDFVTPNEAGEYRLFCSVTNQFHKIGNANFPFLVK